MPVTTAIGSNDISTPLGKLNGATFSADGSATYKIGGVTLDPTATIPVGGSGAATLPNGGTTTGTALLDGQIIPTGIPYLPYGAVLVKNSGNDYYAPWDGVVTLVRGQFIVVDSTLTGYDNGYGNPTGSMNGGRCYITRAKVVTSGAWAAASTGMQTALMAAEPLFQPVYF